MSTYSRARTAVQAVVAACVVAAAAAGCGDVPSPVLLHSSAEGVPHVAGDSTRSI
jgi:hypothetical protein